MAQKTIPQLTEATSIAGTGLLAFDTGVQTYKIAMSDFAKSMRPLTMKSVYVSASTHTVQPDEDVIICEAGVAQTISIGTPSFAKVVRVTKIGGGFNKVTVSGGFYATILNTLGESVLLAYVGGGWVAVERSIPAHEFTYTPVMGNLGAGSVASAHGVCQRDGRFLNIQFRITKDGTPGSGGASVTLDIPSGLEIDPDTSVYPGTASSACGFVSYNVFEAAFIEPVTDDEIVYMGNMTGADFTASLTLYGNIRIPILGWNIQ